MAIVDHITEAQARIIIQYKESETIRKYLDAVLREANELENVYCDLITKRFVDVAVGEQLDFIGLLVGQSRSIVDGSALSFFGFQGAPDSLGFRSLADPLAGARFLARGEDPTGNIILTDDEYRLFIRARIIKNNTRATHEEVIAMVLFILDEDSVDTIEIINGDRGYIVSIGGTLDANEQALISSSDLMPKPIGVRASYAIHDPLDFFEFASIANPAGTTGAGFSTIAAPTVGGTFSKLI